MLKRFILFFSKKQNRIFKHTLKDFSDFTKEKIGSFHPEVHQKKEIVKLIFFKAFYLFYIIIIPASFSVLSLPFVLLAYLLMNCCASLLITLAFIPSHVAEHSFFPLPDKNGVMPYSWSHHQVLTVIDFATKSRLLNFFFGGFNHHVTHHLFSGRKEVFKIDPLQEITPLGFEFRSTVINLMVFFVAGLFIGYSIDHGWTKVYTGSISSMPSILYLIASFFIALLIHDIYFYATHRLCL